MIKLTEIKIHWSELPEAEQARFYKTPQDVARKLNRLDFHESRNEKLGGYYKTKLTLKWEDGSEYGLRYDIGDGKTIGERLNHRTFITQVENGTKKCSPDLLEYYKKHQEFFKNLELPE